METKNYVDAQGNYLGGFSEGNSATPEGAIEVPTAPANASDKWIGGTWTAVETAEQTIERLEGALDRHLDAVANSYRYESIRTMVTYATSDHATFGPEGRAAVAFRDAVYSYGIAKIEACTREVDPEPIPTEEQLIEDCPVFETFLQP